MTKREQQAIEYAAEVGQPQFSCAACGWFARIDDRTGECHRYPPTRPGNLCAEWGFAVTASDETCGEFIHRVTGQRHTDRLERRAATP